MHSELPTLTVSCKPADCPDTQKYECHLDGLENSTRTLNTI